MKDSIRVDKIRQKEKEILFARINQNNKELNDEVEKLKLQLNLNNDHRQETVATLTEQINLMLKREYETENAEKGELVQKIKKSKIILFNK